MRASFGLLAALFAAGAWAQSSAPAESETKPGPYAHYGLLRARDLTPFGFLRLDMRPAHAVSAPAGTWGVEVELDYQNTWAMSDNVKDYLESLNGRRKIGPAEIQAIRALPGESYLVDLELGLLDVTYHYSFADRWETYASVRAVDYTGGFLDGGIEAFHKAFGIPSSGRRAVERNDTNIIFNLKSTQVTQPDIPDSGVLDPVVGLRYRFARDPTTWNLVVEGAVKVPVGGVRPFLSTGHWDVGTQVTLQGFMERHAAYASLAAVYAKVSDVVPTAGTKVVPTAILGYEYTWTERTNLNAQFYASPSVFSHKDTDLDDLLRPKYQVSLGVRHRIGASLLTFGFTENIANFNNTPDIGFQLGWAYSPAFAR